MNHTNEYSPEEKQILRDIYASPETIESQVHRLPLRSLSSIEAKARVMGLKKTRQKPLMERISDLMSDGRPRTAAQLAKLVGGKRKFICEQLRLASDGLRYHIHSHSGSHRAIVFKAGPGKNAERPPAVQTPGAEYSRRYRERMGIKARVPKAAKPAKPAKAPKPAKAVVTPRKPVLGDKAKDDLHRSKAAWWPAIDPIIPGAMRAMVEAGRAAQ